jgi:hypothetical protein
MSCYWACTFTIRFSFALSNKDAIYASWPPYTKSLLGYSHELGTEADKHWHGGMRCTTNRSGCCIPPQHPPTPSLCSDKSHVCTQAHKHWPWRHATIQPSQPTLHPFSALFRRSPALRPALPRFWQLGGGLTRCFGEHTLM